MKRYLVTYLATKHNGHWWLTDSVWKKLARHGWLVVRLATQQPRRDHGKKYLLDRTGLPKLFTHPKDTYSDGRPLEPFATTAFKRFESMQDAVLEFETITGQKVHTKECNCCAPPHTFTWEDETGNGGYYAN